MIVWITGNSESGKTTLAKQMKTTKSIILDGDEIRNIYPAGFIKEERWGNNLKIAKLAKMLEAQGFDVIVAVICPYKELREEVQNITNCSFIYLSGGVVDDNYPYEYDDDKYYLDKHEVRVIDYSCSNTT